MKNKIIAVVLLAAATLLATGTSVVTSVAANGIRGNANSL